VLCAVFWTWIWGPIGLLLSTPLTMCMAIVGRHVEHLKFLDILLGDRAPLAPEEAFYLSMLAGKTDEEAARAEAVLKDSSLAEYLDTVAIPGLALAHIDESRGGLDARGGERIHASVRALLDDIGDLRAAPEAGMSPAETPVAIVCVAGRGELDFAAATLLVAVLGRRGIPARAVSSQMTSSAHIAELDGGETRVVCLSYLSPSNHKTVRYLARRLRRHLPHVLILACFWNEDHDDTQFLDALESTACDGIATGLGEAVAQLSAMLKAETVPCTDNKPECATEAAE
jgi:hypothetical protein